MSRLNLNVYIHGYVTHTISPYLSRRFTTNREISFFLCSYQGRYFHGIVLSPQNVNYLTKYANIHINSNFRPILDKNRNMSTKCIKNR